ncbi:MAG TPA: arginine N-succinyltransferase [Ideonella sp.]|uniref:arginine N-succinyltransferase n=1 Tax=Ideonella sp. TaxID=1929293 RepID=UPI002E31CFFD|nr:arginine N-succinyltransferase [Ideonella sp.]HEX5683738.1 arginine N-succinyltransferase [Ideonella sp.]
MSELHLRATAEHTPGTWRLALTEPPATQGDQPRVLATLLVVDQAGLQEPRHWFHLGRALHASAELNLFRLQQTLLLGSDLCGAAELAELRADAGRAEAPRLLVEAALAWLAMRRMRAERQGAASPGARVFAELPGIRDAHGHSPFWQGLGQHCLPMGPAQAERRFGAAWVRGLAPLLPRQPVMVALLSDAAQTALSRPAEDARPWADALAANGLHAGQHVTVFDGGPVHEGHLDAPVARGGRWLSTAAVDVTPTSRCWLALEGDSGLRLAAARVDGEELQMSQASLAQLGTTAATRLWAAPASAGAEAVAGHSRSSEQP